LDGRVYLRLPSVKELDRLLGAERWKVKPSEAQDPFAEMDRKIARNGRGGGLLGLRCEVRGGE
jgi:nitrite reductase (NAD(P)H)